MGQSLQSHPIVRKCRVYKRKDRPNRWIIILYWNGVRYQRSHYDYLPIDSEARAFRLASQINGDIATSSQQPATD
ncbi:MAG: hypothetical protein HY787_25225 [Deltaproteobacteria bacterium]|nr:hypothetical protein [Deltaproteobacteria bacterium]